MKGQRSGVFTTVLASTTLVFAVLIGVSACGTDSQVANKSFRNLGTQLPQGWSMPAGDLYGNRCYPIGARHSTAAGKQGLTVKWSAGEPVEQVFTGDVNGDGKLEIVAGSRSDIYIYDSSGKKLGGFKTKGESCCLCGLFDLRGSGNKSILVQDCTAGTVHILAYEPQGKLIQTFAKQGQKDCGAAVYGVVDLAHDGHRKLVVWFNSGYSGALRGISIFDVETGKELNHFRLGIGSSNLCIGDLAGDGKLQVVVGSGGPANGMTGEDGANDMSSYAWCFDSSLKKLWRRGPFDQGGFYDSSVMLAAIGKNSTPSILVAPSSHGWQDFSGQVGRLLMLDGRDGSTVEGYYRDFGQPVRLEALGDLKGDKSKQIVIVREDRRAGTFFVEALDAKPGFDTWKQFNAGPHCPAVHAVADLGGVGRPQVIVSVGSTLYVLRNDLTVACTWSRGNPRQYPIRQAIVSDLYGDGQQMLLVISGQDKDLRLDVLGNR